MSSNSIHSGVKLENYVAMVKAIRGHGKYPPLFYTGDEHDSERAYTRF